MGEYRCAMRLVSIFYLLYRSRMLIWLCICWCVCECFFACLQFYTNCYDVSHPFTRRIWLKPSPALSVVSRWSREIWSVACPVPISSMRAASHGGSVWKPRVHWTTRKCWKPCSQGTKHRWGPFKFLRNFGKFKVFTFDSTSIFCMFVAI